MRSMSFDEIVETIDRDINFEFEVLAPWSFLGENFVPGRLMRAAHYNQILDFVRDGLKLGKPMNGGALNTAAENARVRAAARAAGRNGPQ